MAKDKSSNEGCIGCLGLIIIVGIIAFAFHSCLSGSSSKESDNTSMIITIAQDAVKKQLKTPSSAKFPWGFDEYKIKEVASENSELKTYYVQGYVDAENSFGAKIRTEFIVKLELNDDGEKYKILDVKLNE